MGEENNFGVPADGGQFDNLDLDDDYTTEDTPSSTPGETGPMASVEKLFTPLNMMIMLGILVVVGVIGSIALAVVYEVYMLPVLFVIAVSVPCGLYYAFWLFKDKDQANAAFMGLFCVLGGIGYIVKGIMILVLAIGFVFLVMIAALVIFGLLLNGADQGSAGLVVLLLVIAGLGVLVLVLLPIVFLVPIFLATFPVRWVKGSQYSGTLYGMSAGIGFGITTAAFEVWHAAVMYHEYYSFGMGALLSLLFTVKSTCDCMVLAAVGAAMGRQQRQKRPARGFFTGYAIMAGYFFFCILLPIGLNILISGTVVGATMAGDIKNESSTGDDPSSPLPAPPPGLAANATASASEDNMVANPNALLGPLPGIWGCVQAVCALGYAAMMAGLIYRWRLSDLADNSTNGGSPQPDLHMDDISSMGDGKELDFDVEGGVQPPSQQYEMQIS